MAIIGEKARKTLEKSIGLSLNQVYELSLHEEISLVKAKTGKSLYFTKSYDPRKIGRGNPLLAQRKITSIEEINAKIDAAK